MHDMTGGISKGDLSTPPRHLSQGDNAPRAEKRPEVLSALALATVLYSVKPGDTLSGIAQQYNTTWEAIYHDNQSVIKNPNVVYVGEQLRVPQGDLTASLVPVQAPAAQSAQTAPAAASSDSGQSGAVKSYNVTPAAAPTTTQRTSESASSGGSGSGSGALSDIPGVPSSFAACVAYRESTNNTNPAAHGDAYGIIPASGHNVSGDSIAQQKQVFKEIYDTTGASAWAADGC
jgi:LysM repeat protein